MPSLAKLSEAAIVLSKTLEDFNIEHGIFGGYAIGILGGPRESKDIDCAVNCSKDYLITALSKAKGFMLSGNIRPDFASLFYGESNILIELFPTSMSMMTTQQVQVSGERSGIGVTKILHPVLIYKGKLQAAATRAKHSDAADLLYLEGVYNAALTESNNQISRNLVGMALKRYPHLQHSFVRLGLDLEACIASAKDFDINVLPATPAANAVQNALLFNLRAPSLTTQTQTPTAGSSHRIPAGNTSSIYSLPLDQTVHISGRYYRRTQHGLFVANGSQWVPVPLQKGGQGNTQSEEDEDEEDEENEEEDEE